MTDRAPVQKKIHRALLEIGEDGATISELLAAIHATGYKITRANLLHSLNRGTGAGVFRVVGDRGARANKRWTVRDEEYTPKTVRPRTRISSIRRATEPPQQVNRIEYGGPCTVVRTTTDGFTVSLPFSSRNAAELEVRMNGGEIRDSSG